VEISHKNALGLFQHNSSKKFCKDMVQALL